LYYKVVSFWLFLFFLACPYTIFSDEWKKVYLASYPRSGNHWVRFLIEDATGIATSSVFPDQEQPKRHLLQPFPWGAYSTDHGYYGNCRYPTPNDMVVIKIHFPLFTPVDSSFPYPPGVKTIRIVRHPVDSFYSYLVYMKRAPARHIAKEELIDLISSWKRFEQYWNNQPNVVTFLYEDIFKSPVKKLTQILQAIGYQVPRKKVVEAVRKFPPQGDILKHIDRFHREDLKIIKRQLKDSMLKYGYHIPKKYLKPRKTWKQNKIKKT